MSASTPKEAVYDAEIFPLMKQILEICKRERINMGAMFSLGHPEDADDPEALLTCWSGLTFDKAEDPQGHERALDVILAAKGKGDLISVRRIVQGTKK